MDRIKNNDRYHRYSAYNPTLGTGIAMGIVAAFSQNAALFTIVNPAASKLFHQPERLAFKVTADDTNSTNLLAALVKDPTVRTAGTPGGSAITQVEDRFTVLRTSPVLIRFGAVTPADADAGAVRVAQRVLKATGVAVGDEFILDFDQVRPDGKFMGCGPIPPGHSMVLHLWGASMAADAPAFEFAYQGREIVKTKNLD